MPKSETRSQNPWGTKFRTLFPLAVLVGGLLALAACATPPGGGAPPRMMTIATFYPLAYFTQQVGGQRAQVATLVPPGVEPHDWEPGPQEITAINKAALFVYNGAGFEPWVGRALAGLPSKRPVVVEASAGIPLLKAEEGRGAAPDPHVWLDPVLAQAQVRLILEGLVKADKANEDSYQRNATTLTGRLEALNVAYRRGLASCPKRTVVTSHDSLRYLAQRYGLKAVPASGLSPEAEPGPARLAALVRTVRQEGVRYVFAETLLSPAVAQAIARETGAQVLLFNPLEGLTPEEQKAGEDYFSIMEANLANLRQALECP